MFEHDIAKWYVKQVLDAITCEDQTNTSNEEETNCLYLKIKFSTLIRFRVHSQQFNIKEVERLYNLYISKYIDIVNKFYYEDYYVKISSVLNIAVEWLGITLSDILELNDSKDYPKGLLCNSNYWDKGMFEEHLDMYSLDDYKVVADFIDCKMLQLFTEINEQRLLDEI